MILPAGGFKMDDSERERRKYTFDEIPELYDQARPTYPEAAFDELSRVIGTEPSQTHIVEIGAGTGKATLPLLSRGYQVTAVELGGSLSAFLRKSTAEFGDQIEVVNAAFEDVELPERVDALLAAMAWHWIDVEAGMAKAHSILHPGGVLAILDIVQVAPDVDSATSDFFTANQAIHREVGLDRGRFAPPARGQIVNHHVAKLEQSSLFTDVREFRVDWDQRYSAERYVQLRQTDSDLNSLDAESRANYLERMHQLIESDFGGEIVRPGVACLCTAHAADLDVIS